VAERQEARYRGGVDDDDRPQPGDFLDALDALDEVDLDEDEEEPFVPLFSRPWAKAVALFVAIAMAAGIGYSGLRIILDALGN